MDDHAKRAGRATGSRERRTSSSGPSATRPHETRSRTAALLRLQRAGGNRAVRQVVSRADGIPPRTTLEPPTKYRLKRIETPGTVSHTGETRPALRLHPDTGGAEEITRLPFGTGLVVHSELSDHPSWWFVTVPSLGVQGYIYRELCALTPDADPDTRLVRIQGGTGMFDLVRAGRYGEMKKHEWILYAYIIWYLNRRERRPGIGAPPQFTLALPLIRPFGTPLNYEVRQKGAWTVHEGRAVWIPGKALAATLAAAAIPAHLRKLETAVGFRRKLSKAVDVIKAVGLFLAGLPVGVLNWFIDTVKGILHLLGMAWNVFWKFITGTLFEYLWEIGKAFVKWASSADNWVNFAKSVWGALKGEWMKGWYARGKLIGRGIAEIFFIIVTAGAGAIVTATRWVSRLFSALSTIKGIGPLLTRAGSAARGSKVGKQLATWQSERAARLAKARAEGAAGSQTLAGVNAATWATIEYMAKKLGYSETRLAHLANYAQRHKISLILRPSNPSSVARLAEGALPKPIYIKAKTISRADLHLYKGLKEADLGKVGYFKPTKPSRKAPPGWDESKLPWSTVRERYKQRADEYARLRKDMDKLRSDPARRQGSDIDKYKGAQAQIDDGVVKLKKPGAKDWKPVTADIDAFQILGKRGEVLSPKEYARHVRRLEEAGLIEHGAHMWWQIASRSDRLAYQAVLESHRRGEALAEIVHTGAIRMVRAEDVPGVLAAQASKAAETAGRAGQGASVKERLEGAGRK